MFKSIYHNKRVLITGHTGFKGSWLALWLSKMGAEITGYALQPPTEPNHYYLLQTGINSIIGDIRDTKKLDRVFQEQRPDIVFHLAAQSIVRLSYKIPVETFSSNAIGTLNIFEATRKCDSVRAIINITSDKCYDPNGRSGDYRETDPLGGYDPYSASKGCSEIITSCWRNSYFNLRDYGNSHQTLLASARAGNVIGGGDWAVDRLLPDIMRAASQNKKVKIRNPHAIRPWQHVLDPLGGYLLIGQKLLEKHKEFAEAWNLGPSNDGHATVAEIADRAKKAWSKTDYEIDVNPVQPHESDILSLDCSKATKKLKWKPVWDWQTAVNKTVLWYMSFYESGKIQSLTDFNRYIADAKKIGMPWAKE